MIIIENQETGSSKHNVIVSTYETQPENKSINNTDTKQKKEHKGKKGKYEEWLTEDGLAEIRSLARHGLNDEKIAECLGIKRQQIYTWFKRFPQIKQAVKDGRKKELVDQEEALKKAGLGYTVKVKKPIKLREEKQKAGEGKIVTERIHYVEEEIYYPPNIVALIFYLKNRAPEYWKDKPVLEKTGADDPLTELLRRFDEDAEAGREQAEVQQTSDESETT